MSRPLQEAEDRLREGTVLSSDPGVLSLVGDIDVRTVSRVQEAVRICLDAQPTAVCVDLSGVTFCDCAGINVMLWARREAGRTGTGFSLRGPLRPVVARVFTLTGADSFVSPARAA
ncbi:STAS domain-containing protein [Streptomyces sp. URMC 123]|uniref:STAS domain-containing protein n=1 Tax=Streptomyces sp. URMC 123 TaxID=3423403 RepID=UPI003F1A4D80